MLQLKKTYRSPGFARVSLSGWWGSGLKRSYVQVTDPPIVPRVRTTRPCPLFPAITGISDGTLIFVGGVNAALPSVYVGVACGGGNGMVFDADTTAVRQLVGGGVDGGEDEHAIAS